MRKASGQAPASARWLKLVLVAALGAGGCAEMWAAPEPVFQDVSADGLTTESGDGANVPAPDAGPAEDPSTPAAAEEDRWPCAMGQIGMCTCDNGTLGQSDCKADPSSPLDGYFADECTACGDVVAGDCTDGIVSGDESDVDCGGMACGPCPVGSACNGKVDCMGSAICGNGVCVGEGGTTDPNAVASCAGQPDGTGCTTPLLPCSAAQTPKCLIGLCGCM